MPPLRWTTKSTRTLAAAPSPARVTGSAPTPLVTCCGPRGSACRATLRRSRASGTRTGDAQFRYINEQVKAHQGTVDPVISVDTKKKENVGEFKNGGRELGGPRASRPGCAPTTSRMSSWARPFPTGSMTWPRTPAGQRRHGPRHGRVRRRVDPPLVERGGPGCLPRCRRLLITADAGGSNGYRTRAWKAELAAFALQAGLAVTVCHFPPGTSKWNWIEHRLFSHITMNWRGRPLTSHEVIVNTIAATTTRTGLTVRAELDPWHL